MPSLQVRDLDQETYNAIVELSRKENRSITQQTVVLLQNALENPQERRSKRQAVLTEIRNQKLKHTDKLDSLDIVQMIREDRDR